ncbi:MAG: zf-HC2 domain-containing protein [Candidatus Dormibacteraeota bacterium]|uniref:Zf-HC2 domain-containing protein n=1 Tax=Candidatus Dormiibacter inghamiae TaxID=3127013 RepID=A0A934NEH2_9BACT|nr:zf-HC2 domain-containing protein [Candidatus Dormibacteraeota bacterium]MBJ7606334.1 zf-HC2 domain-containing protein [Candidatus Dormibacteraeota bacterium]
MTCAEVRSRLEAMVDGELDAALPDVRQHLAVCDACRRQHEEAASLPSRIRALPAPALPADLVTQVLVRVGPRSRPLREWGLLASEALLGLIVVWYVSGLDGLLGLGQRTLSELAEALGWQPGHALAPSGGVDLFLLLLALGLTLLATYHLSLVSRDLRRSR